MSAGYLRPRTLDEALAARRDHPDWTVLAGGTDLLVAANTRPEPPGVLDLFGLDPLRGISEADDGAIRLGAATTYADILASEVCQRELPALVACAREVGALQIQARGTLGGNMITSSPVGDTLPVLLAFDAVALLASAESRREVPYHDFITGYRTTALGSDELLLGVRIPPRGPLTVQHWRKVGTRRAQSISKVMLAATGRVESGHIAHLRLALGAVADRPIRALDAEAAAMGQPPGEETAARVRDALAEEITPIDDVRSRARYRLRVAQNLCARFILML